MDKHSTINGRHFSVQCLLPDLVEKGSSIIIIQYEVKHYDRVLNFKIFPVTITNGIKVLLFKV